MSTPIIKFDFQNDFSEYCKNCLLAYGVEIPSTNKEIRYLYWRVYQRLIHGNTPRMIYRSSAFCLPSDSNLLYGLQILEEKITKGESINAHLSKFTLNPLDPHFNDGMLNDWGIHHFHLGTSYQTNNLIERTSQLLYGVVTQDSFYEICIAEHGHWTDKELLQIINDNWKHLLDRFIVRGIEISNQVSNSDLHTLRSNAINCPVVLNDGTILLCPGGGIATNGSSVVATELYDNYDRILHDYTALFESPKKQQSLIDFCRQHNPSLDTITEINVKMRFDDNDIFNPKFDISGY